MSRGTRVLVEGTGYEPGYEVLVEGTGYEPGYEGTNAGVRGY